MQSDFSAPRDATGPGHRETRASASVFEPRLIQAEYDMSLPVVSIVTPSCKPEHFERLASNSNSNPGANPNQGYCFSDYIDLLVASHVTGVITRWKNLRACVSRRLPWHIVWERSSRRLTRLAIATCPVSKRLQFIRSDS